MRETPHRPPRACLTALLLIIFAAAPLFAAPFELRDGDRVALVGNTLIEREQREGYVETALTLRWPNRNVTYRNFGWSGDDVFGTSRGVFEVNRRDVTFKRLIDAVAAFKPTVIVVGYGGNAAFAGDAGLKPFVAQFERLIGELAKTRARLVILSPLRLEKLGAPLPDPAEQNKRLTAYTGEIGRVARENRHRFVDLFNYFGRPSKTERDVPLTSNSMHLTPYGYWRLGKSMLSQLETPAARWHIMIDLNKNKQEADGATLKAFKATAQSVQFKSKATHLPLPPAPHYDEKQRVIHIHGLKPGRYTLNIDGKAVTTRPAGDWSVGVRLNDTPDAQQAEQLRNTIVEKNELFFHQWRPQNVTYLFLFRKHEQGQNAKEMPMFDPLILAKEKQIATLRVPVERTYELKRVKGGE